MEEAVPERRFEDDSSTSDGYGAGYEEEDYEIDADEPAQPEAPVDVDPTRLPTQRRAEADAAPSRDCRAGRRRAERGAEPSPREEDDGRMKAVDLIAPTRLDFLKREEAAPEAETGRPPPK